MADTQLLKSSMITVKDAQNLLAFFKPKKVKRLKLLYRASQSWFQADQFHKKCDGIPHTLTVCKTQFNKIIGGYTPLTWQSPQNPQRVEDESGQSFIFSLTYNHKFTLRDKICYAIKRDKYSGPIFGAGPDLLIDRYEGWAKICCTYVNPNYEFEQKSRQRFSGNEHQHLSFSDEKFEYNLCESELTIKRQQCSWKAGCDNQIFKDANLLPILIINNSDFNQIFFKHSTLQSVDQFNYQILKELFI